MGNKTNKSIYDRKTQNSDDSTTLKPRLDQLDDLCQSPFRGNISHFIFVYKKEVLDLLSI